MYHLQQQQQEIYQTMVVKWVEGGVEAAMTLRSWPIPRVGQTLVLIQLDDDNDLASRVFLRVSNIQLWGFSTGLQRVVIDAKFIRRTNCY